jgi:hypothetical protein
VKTHRKPPDPSFSLITPVAQIKYNKIAVGIHYPEKARIMPILQLTGKCLT